MGKLPIIGKWDNAPCPAGGPLPTGYMGDYSVLAVMVGEPDKAVGVLQKNGYSITGSDGAREIRFDDASGMRGIFKLLQNHSIDFTLSDSVTQIYQG